jgi:hypothetical protein
VQVFVSYSVQDIECARNISAVIGSMELVPWLELKESPYTSEWRTPVFQAIGCSMALVALVTDHFLRSQQCQIECLYASSRGIPIVDVRFTPQSRKQDFVGPLSSESLQLSDDADIGAIVNSAILSRAMLW